MNTSTHQKDLHVPLLDHNTGNMSTRSIMNISRLSLNRREENSIMITSILNATDGKITKYVSTRNLAVILMNLNILQQIVFMALSKYSVVYLGVAPVDLCLGRTAMFLLVTIPFLYIYDTSITRDITTKNRFLLFVMGIIGAIGYGTQTFCIMSMPVMIWTLIINCAPFLAAILSYIILKEKVSRCYVYCVIGSFASIVIVSCSQEDTSKPLSKTKIIKYSLTFGIVCAIVDTISYSMTIVGNRFFEKVHWTIQMMYYSIAGVLCFIGLAVGIYYSDPNSKEYPTFYYYNSTQWLYVFMIAVLATIANIFQTFAFQSTPSAFISMIGLINVVYGFLVDVLFFHASFKVIQIVGAVFILGFNLVSLLDKDLGHQANQSHIEPSSPSESKQQIKDKWSSAKKNEDS